MTLGGERAHQIAMDMRDDRRDREDRPHPALAQYLAQRREPLIGAEQRLGRREVGGGNALRPRGNAQINGDRNAAAGAIRPADLGVREAPSSGRSGARASRCAAPGRTGTGVSGRLKGQRAFRLKDAEAWWLAYE